MNDFLFGFLRGYAVADVIAGNPDYPQFPYVLGEIGRLVGLPPGELYQKYYPFIQKLERLVARFSK